MILLGGIFLSCFQICADGQFVMFMVLGISCEFCIGGCCEELNCGSNVRGG